MRDFGALIWAAIVIAGVISSIVSSARKQNAARVQVFRAPPSSDVARTPGPAVSRPRPPAAPTKATAAPEPSWGLLQTRDLAETHKQATRTARSLFGRRAALVRAIVAAEVLGKPHALRDEA